MLLMPMIFLMKCVRMTHFGDKTMNKWINSEWHNLGIGWPHGYPSVPLPADYYEWDRFTPEERKDITMNIGWNGSISASGKQMHGIDYGWYVNARYYCGQTWTCQLSEAVSRATVANLPGLCPLGNI